MEQNSSHSDENCQKSKHNEFVDFLIKTRDSGDKKWFSKLKKNPEFYKLLFSETNFLPSEASNLERRYCILCGIHERVVCAECHSKFVKLDTSKRGGPRYQKFCSNHCARHNKLVHEKWMKTNLERYGFRTPSQNKEVQKRVEETFIKKYGVKRAIQNNAVKEKIKKTTLERYGVENVFQSQEIKDKIRKTCIEKYGVEYVTQNKSTKEKMKKSNLERYGVECVSKNKNIRDKAKRTNMMRYGVEHPLLNDEIQRKARNTTFEHYGVEYPAQSELVRIKQYKTLRFKYGSDGMPKVSIGEKELRDECKLIYSGEIIFNDREVLGHTRELDLWFPALSFAIEFDGNYWHSKPKHMRSDIWKNTRCKNLNIILLRVPEEEWKRSRKDIISVIKTIFNVLTSDDNGAKERLRTIIANQLDNRKEFGVLLEELKVL